MRKATSIFLATLFVFQASPAFATEPRSGAKGKDLQARAVDPKRKINWHRECIVRLAHDEWRKLAFRKNDGSISKVGSIVHLPAGEPIVVRRINGVALWRYGCGNDILEDNWEPEGEMDCGQNLEAFEGQPETKAVRDEKCGMPDHAVPMQRESNITILNLNYPAPKEDPPPKALRLGLEKKSFCARHTAGCVIGGIVIASGLVYAGSRLFGRNGPSRGGPAPDPKD